MPVWLKAYVRARIATFLTASVRARMRTSASTRVCDHVCGCVSLRPSMSVLSSVYACTRGCACVCLRVPTCAFRVPFRLGWVCLFARSLSAAFARGGTSTPQLTKMRLSVKGDRGLRRVLHTARVMADQTHFRENLPSLTHS